MASSKVRSIQGEEQGELVPNRRAKFRGMSINDLGEPLTKRQQVRLIVEGTVTGIHDDDRKDGVPIETAVIDVTQVEVDKVIEADAEPTFDDLYEG